MEDIISQIGVWLSKEALLEFRGTCMMARDKLIWRWESAYNDTLLRKCRKAARLAREQGRDPDVAWRLNFLRFLAQCPTQPCGEPGTPS